MSSSNDGTSIDAPRTEILPPRDAVARRDWVEDAEDAWERDSRLDAYVQTYYQEARDG